MLLAAGAEHVIAIEPSHAFEVLCRNIVDRRRVTCLKITGDQLPPYGDLDYIFSIGVLHHIRDPIPAVEAAFRALRPGGRFLVWLYGKEGNTLYLMLLKPLRIITKHLPYFILVTLVEIIHWPLGFYVKLCRRFPLPMHGYLLSVFGKMSPAKRKLIIYDQLNPSYAKYYMRNEAEGLLAGMGFADVLVHHRHGYSWTVIGTKPQS
jgi:SAM-dependent methyltransferase